MNFTDFVNQNRINQAKTQLLQDKNISETGYAVGFESISHFNKVFKKNTRETPGQFKKAVFMREPIESWFLQIC